MEEPILVRPREAAQMIRVSKSKIYEMIAAKVLPSVRLQNGRMIRVPVSALKAIAGKATSHEDNDAL